MVLINYQNQTNYDMDAYVKVFEQIAKYTLKEFNMKGKIELSVTLVSRNTIHEINRQYRNVDRITDVISFEYGEGFPIEDGSIMLGDLFICVSRAKTQAKKYGHSIYREVCFLFTHGLLHLLKMDHMNKEDEEKMIAMQNKIMDHFKIIR